MVSQIATAVFSFVSVWLATQSLGAEGYGILAAILVASQLAQIFVMWTCTAMGRYGVQEFVGTGQISETFWTRTAILIPNLILMCALAPFWYQALALWLKLPSEAFVFVLWHFLATGLAMHVQFALQGAKLLRWQSILLVIERLIVLFLLAVLIWSGHLTWFQAVAAYSVAPFLSALLGLWVLKPFLGRVNFSRKRGKEILKFSFPLIFYSLLGHLSLNHLDAIFIQQYLTPADLGIYMVAYQINGLILQLPTLAGSLVMPWFVTFESSNAESEKIRRAYFREVLPVITLGFGLAGTFAAAVGFYALPLIFGVKFQPVGELLWAFTAACVFAAPVLTGFAPLSHSTSATAVATTATAFSAIVKVLLNFLLIIPFGSVGCAWATAVSFGVSLLAYALIMRRKFEIPILSVLLSTLPSVFAAACFSLSRNVFLSLIVALILAFVLFIIKRDSFTGGFKKLLLRNRFGKTVNV